MDAKRTGARRLLGRDYESFYAETVPDLIVMHIEECDPVTQEDDFVYIATKAPFWMRRALQGGLVVRILE